MKRVPPSRAPSVPATILPRESTNAQRPPAFRPITSLPLRERIKDISRPGPVNERHTLSKKSPDDLKAILRTMTAKNSIEVKKNQTHQQHSLKGVLADVLAKDPSLEGKQPFEVSESALRKVLRDDT